MPMKISESNKEIQEIIARLEEILKEDIPFDSGKVIGSMCTKPHEIAAEVFKKYIDRNAGDYGISRGTAKIEREVILWLSKILGGDERVVGNIVSGGSEANLLGLYSARKHKKISGRPEIIASEAVHISIDKAADILGLKLIKVPPDRDTYNMDLAAVEDKINENTIALVGVAGTTGLGIIEPIKELSQLALEHDLHLHVDAAFGGFVIPFLRDLGYNVPEIGFHLKGILSMTVDPHKMGMVPIPAGGILFRDETVRERIKFNIYYLSGGPTRSATITGTRPGAPIIAAWVLINYLGIEGYKNIVKQVMELTSWFSKRIEELDGVELVIKPVMNIVGIRPTEKSIDAVEIELRKRGWAISRFPSFLRVVIMPHVKKEHLEKFLSDLEDILRDSDI